MNDRQPVIGVTRCNRMDDYVTSVEHAGGRVRVLETGESPRRVIGEIDGLLLTGGGDIDPVFYGQDRHPSVEDAEPGRDEFEIDLARRAVAANLPLLAICRGTQVLNVAAGGSLVQDIPSSQPAGLEHSVQTPRDARAHDVRISAGSRLERALGAAVNPVRSCQVNSRHHQSVERLGEGLVATAAAADGVIEAIERPDAAFCVGVQWHPENFCRTGEFDSLFESFVSAAKEGATRHR
jgi:putative glutamine amidotransferase